MKIKMKKKDHRSFDPDEVATRLSQALGRDLQHLPVKQLYHGSNTFDITTNITANFLRKYKRTSHDEEQTYANTRTAWLDNLLRMEYVDLSSIRDHMYSRSLPRLSYDRVVRVVERAAGLINWVLDPRTLSIEDWFRGCRNSAGVTLGTRWVDSSDSAKFSYPITGTSEAISLFRQYLITDPALEKALVRWNINSTSPRYEVVESSRYTTVPKDNTKDRSIAIEPTLNMFFQQGLMAHLVELMKDRLSLDLEVLQEQHKDLACVSSCTGSLSTIDFSMASDSISYELCELLLPKKWFTTLTSVACKSIEVDGATVQLPIISTMGNATTFPLETLIFYAIAVASISYDSEPSNSALVSWESRELVSVFGDDVILPSINAKSFMEDAEKLGLIVNREKSHYEDDSFRESCGGDYFAFHDVRPYFLSRPEDTRISGLAPWLYVTFNAFQKKYISYFGETGYVYHTELFQEICDILSNSGHMFQLVPDYYPDDAGIQFCDVRLYKNLRGQFAPVVADKHGTAKFRYMRFQYRGKSKNAAEKGKSFLFGATLDESIPYWKALQPVIGRKSFYKRKESGGWCISTALGDFGYSSTRVDGSYWTPTHRKVPGGWAAVKHRINLKLD